MRFKGFKGEWKTYTLGEIAKFSKGKGISKNDIDEDGQTECIRYGELYTHYTEVISEIKSKTNIDKANLVFSKANDVIIPASGETQIDIATASCVLKEGIALGGDLNIVRTPYNGVFLSYYLNSKKKIEIANLAQGISVVHLYSSQLARLNINLPSSIEQDKMASFLSLLDVRILTQSKIIKEMKLLKVLLCKNLFSRKINFRDNFNKPFSGWELKKLGELGKFYAGGDLNKLEYNKEKNGKYVFPIYANGAGEGIYGYSSTFQFPSNCVTVSGRGNLGYANVRKEPFNAIVRLIVIVPNENIEPKFLEEGINNINFATESTGVPQLTIPQITNYNIEIPCKEEQRRIANLLTSIDDQVNLNIKIYELLVKQKQYFLNQMFI